QCCDSYSSVSRRVWLHRPDRLYDPRRSGRQLSSTQQTRTTAQWPFLLCFACIVVSLRFSPLLLVLFGHGPLFSKWSIGPSHLPRSRDLPDRRRLQEFDVIPAYPLPSAVQHTPICRSTSGSQNALIQIRVRCT